MLFKKWFYSSSADRKNRILLHAALSTAGKGFETTTNMVPLK
jgi:hypothetical protein